MALSLGASAVSYGARMLADNVCKTGVISCGYASDDATCAPYDNAYVDPENNYFLLIITAVFAASMAFSIGGNDGANAWATTIHSFAITLRPACILAAIFEILGASTIGYGVSTSIQKGITKLTTPECFACGYCNSSMSLYYIGMMASLISASVFLITATWLKMPVSTTHAIVSSVFGMTIAFHGFGCIEMGMSNLGGVIASWFISPAVSGVMCVVIYYITQFVVFRAKNPRERAFLFVPVLYFVVIFVVVFLIFVKAPVLKKEPHWKGLVAGASAGALLVIVLQVFVMPRLRKELPSVNDANRIGMHTTMNSDADKVVKSEETDFKAIQSPVEGKDTDLMVDGPGRESIALQAEYDALSIEQQDAMFMFKHLLVLVACMQSFAHGSNDTANATAAFAAVTVGFKSGINDCSSPESEWWIMLLGGVFLACGIWFIGYRVMTTMGKSICIVSFDRAVCAELAASCTVVGCSLLKIPVSTTHCQVGGIVCVSIASRAGEIKWRLVASIMTTWILTLPVTAGLAALIAYILKFAMEV